MALGKEEKLAVRTMREAGMPLAKIARHLGLNVNTVKSWCRRSNITPKSVNFFAGVEGMICCIQCAAELAGRQTRFCCDRCRRAWWKNHPEQIVRRAVYGFTCARCSKEFTAYGNAKRKYCCHSCYICHRFATRGGRA